VFGLLNLFNFFSNWFEFEAKVEELVFCEVG